MSPRDLGRVLQVLLLGAALGVSWLYLLHVATTGFTFRYQGF